MRTNFFGVALAIVLGTLGGALGISQVLTGEYKVHVISPSNMGLRVQTDAVGGNVASFGSNGDFQIDAPGVVGGRFAVKEGGRVGVGTNSPLAKLDLLGGADDSGANDPQAMAFQYRLGGYRHWIRTRHDSNLGSGNAIDFFVNNSAAAGGSSGPGAGSIHVLTLDSGKVGVGTDTPTEKLSVAGTVQSTSGGFKFPDGSVQTTAASTTYTIARTNVVDVPSDGNSAILLQLDLPTGTYLLSATARFKNNANFLAQNNTRDIYCFFFHEPISFNVSFAGGGLYGWHQTTTMHSVINISSASGSVLFLCHGSPVNQDSVVAIGRRLTAVKIGNLVVQ